MLPTIFIVDDDNLFAQMLSDHLSKTNMYRIEVITKGSDCLKRLHEQPDVIILDYHLESATDEMNKDNGLVILEKIKKANPKIHVVMLSGQDHYGIAAQTISKGAEQYVVKDQNAFNNIDIILKDMTKVA